jgi:hypothetical protein
MHELAVIDCEEFPEDITHVSVVVQIEGRE